MHTHLSGSIVIHTPANGKKTPYYVESDHRSMGVHSYMRFQREWRTTLDTSSDYAHADNLIIPARNKNLLIDTLSYDDTVPPEELTDLLKKHLSRIDGEYGDEGSRQLYRMQQLMSEVYMHYDGELMYAASLNNIGVRGYFALLSQGVHIHLFGVVGNDQSVHLVWSTDRDYVKKLRAKYGDEIHVYRFQTIYDRPLFISTEFVCSYWWRWTKNHLNEPMAFLHAFNALEARLFKDPNIPVSDQAINLKSNKGGEIEE